MVLNVTASATWTQVLEEVAGTGYAVPATGHADIRSLQIKNLGANSCVVEFASSPNNTPADVQRGFPTCTLATGEFAEYDGVVVLVAAKGLWVKVTGTSPNLSVRAAAFEVIP